MYDPKEGKSGMNELINEEMVERIRTIGNAFDDGSDRKTTMTSLGLPYDRPAENVVIMGCQNLRLMPEKKQARVLMLPEFIDMVVGQRE